MQKRDESKEHNLSKIISKLGDLRAQWKKTHPHIYWPFFWVFILIVWVFQHYAGNWIDELGWRCVVNFILVIGFIVVALVFFALDKDRCQKHKMPMSLEPWGLIIFLVGSFLIQGNLYKNQQRLNSLMLINTNYMAVYDEFGDNQRTNEVMAQIAFARGDYPYSKFFTEKAKETKGDDQYKIINLLDSYASTLALNPGENGWSVFTNDVNGLVEEALKYQKMPDAIHHLDSDGYFALPGVRNGMISQLDEIEGRLPNDKWLYIEGVKAKLRTSHDEVSN